MPANLAPPLPPLPPPVASGAPLPVGPSVEAWAAMTPEQRDHFLIAANEATSPPPNAMGEGRPHKKAKTRALDMLGLHFKAMGRVVYLAEEMTVVYPGEEVFVPDLLAVLGVEEPEDDERLAWVVADEGKGLDLVIEVLFRGSRGKDLVDNVRRYAHLGIPEYFVYDRARQQLHGYRLPTSTSTRYQRIVPQQGRYPSSVLGLDLSLQGGRLRFFQGMAELFGTTDLVSRLTGMMAEVEAKAELAEAKAEQAETKTEQALTALREAILSLLQVRQIPCSEDARARLSACDDPRELQHLLMRATTATTAAEVFDQATSAPRS